MNERIVKLFMQAVDSKYIPVPVEDHIPSWTEKFAELIVRECMMLVEGFESTQEVALDEYVDYEASVVLKEHFRIEE